MTINAIKDEYLRICRFERKLSPNTVRAYAFTLQDFSDFLKSVRLTKIEKVTKKEIHAYIQHLNSRLKPTSVLQKKPSYTHFLNTLWRRNSSSIPLSIM